MSRVSRTDECLSDDLDHWRLTRGRGFVFFPVLSSTLDLLDLSEPSERRNSKDRRSLLSSHSEGQKNSSYRKKTEETELIQVEVEQTGPGMRTSERASFDSDKGGQQNVNKTMIKKSSEFIHLTKGFSSPSSQTNTDGYWTSKWENVVLFNLNNHVLQLLQKFRYPPLPALPPPVPERPSNVTVMKGIIWKDIKIKRGQLLLCQLKRLMSRMRSN